MSKAWTGERLETFIFNENAIEHLHRYGLACDMSKDLDVVDIACGEGYGSHLLSLVANKVTGVDISKQTIEQASEKYKRDNLTFREGSASKIPVNDNSVDVVVSFETIEHHDLHQQMLGEIKRILRPNGILIMSSPDKKYYTDIPGYNNPYHVKELYFEEFKDLVNSYFSNTKFYFQRIVTGSVIMPENTSKSFKEYSGNYESIKGTEGFSPLYNLCIASDNELPNINASLFDGKAMYSYQTTLAVNNAVNAVRESLHNEIEHAVKNTERTFKSTWSYKIGNFILIPLKLFKRK